MLAFCLFKLLNDSRINGQYYNKEKNQIVYLKYSYKNYYGLFFE